MYLVALIFPPLAVLLCGKPFQAIVNFFLTLAFYFPGALHALLVVGSRNTERRHNEHLEVMREHTKVVKHATKVVPMPAPIPAPAPAPPPTYQAPAAPKPTPVPIPISIPDPVKLVEPREPFGDRIKAAVVGAKEGAIAGYQGLPEWAQPVTWGLAAGSVFSLFLVAMILFRR